MKTKFRQQRQQYISAHSHTNNNIVKQALHSINDRSNDNDNHDQRKLTLKAINLTTIRTSKESICA